MMLKRTLAAVAAPVAVLGGLAFASGAAHAATTTPTTVTATTHVTNRPDSGHGGIWAYDSFARTLTVTKAATQPADTTITAYTATITDKGGFTTVGGAGTPNQFVSGTKILHNGVKGEVNGSYALTVTAPSTDTLTGVVPATENDNFSTTGAGFTSTTDWPKLAFASATGVVVTGGAYNWTYATACEKWVDSSANGDGNTANDGNITGKICFTPHPFVYHGHVITVNNNSATVGWSDSAHGWPTASHCVEVQEFGYGFTKNGSPHVGFTCDHGNPAADVGYLRGLAAGHTYALRIQPATGTYGDNHPIPGTDDNAHVTVVTTR